MAAADGESTGPASDELREQIIDEAARLFSRRGYEGMSIKDVAEGCKISQSTFHEYFQSKEKLYEAVILSLRAKLSIDRYLDGLGHEDSLENITLLRRYGDGLCDERPPVDSGAGGELRPGGDHPEQRLHLRRGSPAALRTQGDAEQAGFRCRQGAERKK